ncbi:MAG: Gfo/Idh/MocA family oxidoreductase [Kiritimatiellae bacterium]|jgi:predicted dehydrogenase|nr:Gfo/Idh/MocA family oxidoreductase [Kiritimatiellia bacterium]
MTPKVIQVGSGGYGEFYLNYILDDTKPFPAELVAVIDPFADKSKCYDKLIEKKIPIFDSLEEFYVDNRADLAIIATPIHLHSSQSCYAMEHGADVLCEKPISGTLEDAIKMQETANKTGRTLSIGYQLAFDHVIQELKSKILAGDFGKPTNFKCCVCWKRTMSYYTRNNWAGRIATDSGIQVFDSPLNNATAHYLNIMYYLSGKEQTQSSQPTEIESEIYRAHDIENFDTAFLKIKTDADVEIYFATSHAVESNRGPVFELDFEKAKVTFEAHLPYIPTIEYNDGRPTETMEKLEQNNHNKLLQSIDNIKTSNKSLCPIDSAIPHLRTVNKIQEDIRIVNFPRVITEKELLDNDDEATFVTGLKQVMIECFERNKLPSELNIMWSTTPRKQKF